ncbi:MAG TPA: ribonuclease HII [Chitinophagaceae bacterium]|nr:ribonuclease HII [Chitinophagaceae bacterium]
MLKTFFQDQLTEAGCDEAGRGCFAGPVYAAAVILPPGFFHPLLNDSKQLTAGERNELRPIIEKEAISFAVAAVDNEEIDKINILKASIRAMHLSLDKLNKRPRFIIVDGNRFVRYQRLPFQCVIGGDGKYASIAAASILAKTYRDEYMQSLHLEFPYYGWTTNKGYGTEEHRRAMEQHGLSKYHRKTFRLKPVNAELFDC